MEHNAYRPTRVLTVFATAGALAMAPIAVPLCTQSALLAPSVSATRISSQAVHLTDAWSELATNTVTNVIQLAGTALGRNSNVPLPSPTIPLAPIVTQLMLNQLIYVAQLLTGHGASIPGEISTHLTAVGNVAAEIGKALPQVIASQIELPIAAVQAAIGTVTNSSNPLQGLFEAPAAFLDVVLNDKYGLLGIYGPLGLPIVIRNLVTAALYTPPPIIVLPFKKAAAATQRPKAAATTVTPQTSGVAGSARSKSTAQTSSSRKATAAKAGSGNSGHGHANRG